MRIAFTVDGLPQTKGSTRALPGFRAMQCFRAGRPLVVRSTKELAAAIVVTSDNKDLKAWSSTVHKAAWTARASARAGHDPWSGPIALRVLFRLPRPQRLRGEHPHITRPDLDKLVRAVKDALTGVVWQDDGQVTQVIAEKAFAPATGPGPGVDVHVWTIEPALFADPDAFAARAANLLYGCDDGGAAR